MATDKLINQTQGADIIEALSDIATNVGNITYGPQTSADKVVSMTGYAKAPAEAAISQGDTLNEAIGKLEKKADDNATAVADKIDKLTSATAGDIATVTATGEIADSAVAIETTLSDSSDAEVPTSKAVGTYVDGKGYAVGVSSSTANNLVAFNDANGKALKDSGISVATSTTGLADSDTAVPTSKTVKTYVDSTATGISRYLGTITAASGLSTDAKKGDFYIVKTAWTGVHVGDEIIAEKNSPSQTIDGTNWSLLHNEADTDTKYTFATGEDNGTFKVTPSDTGTAQSVPIKGLGNAAYKGVADTVSSSTDLVTSNAVNTKLASYVPNSDFVVAEQNIKSVKQKVGVNLLHTNEFSSGTSDTGIDFTTENGIISAKGTKLVADSYRNIARDDFKASSLYYVVATTTGSPRISLRVFGYKNGSYTQLIDTAGTAEFNTDDYESFLTRVVVGGSVNDTVNASISAMIITKEDYDAGLTEFQQYGAPNYDLTMLQAEDRAALAEEIDAGAKNKVDIASITTTGSSYVFNQLAINALSAGSYVFSYSSTQANSGNIQLVVTNDSTTLASETVTSKSGRNSIAFTINGTATKLTLYSVRAGTYSDFMLCTKAAFGVSNKFVPYRPNYDLVGSMASALNSPTLTVPTKHSNITSVRSGGYFRIGNIVIVNIVCTVGTALPLYQVLFTDLPTPVASSSLNAGDGVAVLSTNTGHILSLTKAGQIINYESAIETGGLEISGVYICS